MTYLVSTDRISQYFLKQMIQESSSFTKSFAHVALLSDVMEIIANSTDPTTLYPSLAAKFERAFSLNGTFLLLIDEELDCYRIQWLNAASTAQANTKPTQQCPYQGSYAEQVAQRVVQKESLLLTGDQLGGQEFSDAPYWRSAFGTSPQPVLLTSLRAKGSIIGLLGVTATTPNTLTRINRSLLQTIARQLTLVVRNETARQRYQTESQYKDILLDISQAVATIQDRKQLFEVILEKIKAIFPFDHVGLLVRDSMHGGYTAFMDIEVYPGVIFLNQTINNNAEREATNAVLQAIIAADQPLITTPDDIRKIYPNFPHDDLLVEKGNPHLILGLLKTGGQPLGIIGFASISVRFLPSHFTLFQAVTDQLSVAVNNVMVNEALRQREQEKALEAAVVSALNIEACREDQMAEVVRIIQAYVPFDLAICSLKEKDPENLVYAFERIGHDEYRTLLPEAVLRMCGLSPETYLSLLRENRYDRSIIVNATDFEELCARDGLQAVIARTFSIRSALIVPLRLSSGGITKLSFQMSLYSRKETGFRDSHRDLMEKIQSSLTLAIERQIAYQEVARLNEQLAQEKAYLQEEIKVQYNFGRIIGESPAIQTVFEQIRQVANTDATVLISGETGTGKELVARAIHDASPRNDKPLVKINCAALPPQLLESELFGHEKGAFTGAVDRRIGKFELAHQGTIFLDEIGEMPLELQSKLLRVLQEREFERVGGSKVLKVDVRIVTATNRDLKQEVANSTFRSDLYYRLHVFPINLPPLRERPEDIPLLAMHFVRTFAKKTGKHITGLTARSLQRMQRYSWPGNIREMEHLLEREIILAKQSELEITPTTSVASSSGATTPSSPSPATARVGQTLREAERDLIYNTLVYCKGRVQGKGGAAELLGINASTLTSRMKKLGIMRQQVIQKVNESEPIQA